jgi:hypothetical protein
MTRSRCISWCASRPAFPAALLLLQSVDQFDARVEAHALAVAGDGLDAERGGEVRLAGAGAADEHDVLGLLGEVVRGELLDLAAVELALVESKPARSRCTGKRAACIW